VAARNQGKHLHSHGARFGDGGEHRETRLIDESILLRSNGEQCVQKFLNMLQVLGLRAMFSTQTSRYLENLCNHWKVWREERRPGPRCHSQSACADSTATQLPKAQAGSHLDLQLEARSILKVTVTQCLSCRGKTLAAPRMTTRALCLRNSCALYVSEEWTITKDNRHGNESD